MSLRHQEVCFGCGRANLFGLLLELQETAPGVLSGRCFIKQDHQGPIPGHAHPGILATALIEAMTLAAGAEFRLEEVVLELEAQASVGTFLTLRAELDSTTVRAAASSDHDQVASARGRLKPCRSA